jgi:Ca2+-transporting ATPase
MGACAFACYLWPWDVEPGHLPAFARAVAFSLLALSPLFHAFNCRSATSSIFSLRPLISRPLVLAVVLSAGIHLVAVLVPSLRTVFQTFQMDGEQWLIMLGLSAVIVPAMEIFKLAQRRGVIARDFGPMSHRR